jgi:hypothetical protein
MNLRMIVTAVTMCLALPAFAVDYSNEVLAIGVGARALGMGGANVAIADDSSAVYWNPAGLPQISHIEISAVQQGREYDGLGLNDVGSSYVFLSGAMNTGSLGTFGAAFMRFGVSDIPEVTGLDAAGVPVQIGTFQTQDFGFLGSWGKSWHKAFSTGLTLKYLSGGTVGLQSMGDASYNYMGVDLGFLVNFGGMSSSLEGLSFGLNLQDLYSPTGGVKWTNTPTNPTDAVDMNPKVGIAYSPQIQFLKDSNSLVRFAVDADPKYQTNTLIHYGGEFWYKDTLAFRAGMRQFLGGLQNLEGTLGVSLKIYILQVDYAFVNYELTPIQYLTLAVKF